MYINDRGEKILVGQEAIDGFVRGVSRLRENRKLHYKTTFQGLPISIENRKGSIRRGVDPDGNEWETKHKQPYGYIPGTKGPDGDAVDVFVGPNADAAHAYVVHINDPETGEYDEDKVFLGFDSRSGAISCFRQHYDDPNKFYRGVDAIPMWKFRDKVFVKKYTEKKLVASIRESRKLLEAVSGKKGGSIEIPIATLLRVVSKKLKKLKFSIKLKGSKPVADNDRRVGKRKVPRVEAAYVPAGMFSSGSLTRESNRDQFGLDKMPNYEGDPPDYGGQAHVFSSTKGMKRAILGHHQDIMIDPETREAEERGVKGQKWGVRHKRKDAAGQRHPRTGKPKPANKRAVDPDRTLSMMSGDVAQGNAMAAKLTAQNQQKAQQGQPVEPKEAHNEALDALGELGWKAAGAIARLTGVGEIFERVESLIRSPKGQKATLTTNRDGGHTISPAPAPGEKPLDPSNPKAVTGTPQEASKALKQASRMASPGVRSILSRAASELAKGGSISQNTYQQFKGAQARYSQYGKSGGKYFTPEREKFFDSLDKEFMKNHIGANPDVQHTGRMESRRSFESRLGSFLREAKKQIYYARPLQKYNSTQEADDLDFLNEAYPGFGINSPRTKRHADLGMGYFHKKIDKAKEVVISGIGKRHGRHHVTAGVASEANHALKNGIPVRFLHEGKLRTVKRIEIREGGRPGGHYARVIFKKGIRESNSD